MYISILCCYLMVWAKNWLTAITVGLTGHNPVCKNLMVSPFTPRREIPRVLYWISLSIHRHLTSWLLVFRKFHSSLFLHVQKSNHSPLLAHGHRHQLLCHSFARITPNTRTLAMQTRISLLNIYTLWTYRLWNDTKVQLMWTYGPMITSVIKWEA